MAEVERHAGPITAWRMNLEITNHQHCVIKIQKTWWIDDNVYHSELLLLMPSFALKEKKERKTRKNGYLFDERSHVKCCQRRLLGWFQYHCITASKSIPKFNTCQKDWEIPGNNCSYNANRFEPCIAEEIAIWNDLKGNRTAWMMNHDRILIASHALLLM